MLRRSSLSCLIVGFFVALPAMAATLDDIRLPPGFSIEIYAEVPNARSLALGSDGVVFVGNRRGDSVYAVKPGGAAGHRVYEIADDLDSPNGIAYFEGDLYVAETSRVSVFRGIDNRLDNPPDAEILDIDLPSESHHGWRYIGVGPDRMLYISIGAPCNICDREGFARIVRMNIDGSGRQVFAEGIRNSVGFTWHPVTGELWFTDNGRDMLGDDIPADELNHAPRAGLHFGYPYCHAGDLPDPQYGDGGDCSDYTAPAQKLGAHVASLGIRFYTGAQFPEEYHEQIFIAEHGSWNRSKKSGYRIMLVRLQGNEVVSYDEFATGWLQGQEAKGRPVDLLVLPDGSLLVSDDANGVIYRIFYEATQ